MKWSLRNLAIRQKLLLITLGICLAVLVLALAAIFSFQMFNFRASFKQDIATLADVVANNSTAALMFDDRKAAAEIVSSVRVKPNIHYACLVNARGEMVAAYGTPTGASLSDYPTPGQYLFRDGDLLYVCQVVLDGKTIGRLLLCADYHGMFQHLLHFYGLLMALVLAGAVLPALLLSHWLAGIITRPLLGLAGAARQVAEKNDYSIRVSPPVSNDELGQLGGAFNQMLARIEEQDADLNLSRQKLGTLINSINGIVWEWNPKTAEFTFVSQQSEAILGYAPAEWLANPAFFRKIVHPDDFEKAARGRSHAVAQGVPLHQEYRMVSAGQDVIWIRESGLASPATDDRLILRGIFQDVTAQFLAADELKKLHRRLLEVSRQSGMAEVATGVLHNVGNVLNSVNVSVSLLGEQLQKSQLAKLQRTALLLQEHADDLPQFLSSDEKGRLVPPFIRQITEVLAAEHERWGDEVASLKRSVEHMKEIVAMQQSFARVSGVIELLDLRELVEDAIHINSDGLQRHGVDIARDYHAVPRVLTEKHKVMQILINLINNAKYAVEPVPRHARRLSVHIHPGRDGFVEVVAQDNGIGISQENLTRIFSLGFTTKKNGHGFGLHSGALAAKELGGTLTAHSDGPGTGARFTLELPVATSERN